MPHRAQPFRTCAAQQFEQHGFGLIVAVVSQCKRFAVLQGFFEGRESCRSRRIFKAGSGPAFDRYAVNFQRHRQLRGKPLAMFGPAHAFGVKSMIHMQGAQAALARRRSARQNMQQNARIKPTAQRRNHTPVRQCRKAFFYSADKNIGRHAPMVPERTFCVVADDAVG